jgi:tRNA U38,U39,U40 pseudouridine synthase TruA
MLPVPFSRHPQRHLDDSQSHFARVLTGKERLCPTAQAVCGRTDAGVHAASLMMSAHGTDPGTDPDLETM